MRLTRRAALKGLAGAVGAVSGAAAYGVAMNATARRHAKPTLPVSGLPPALDGIRIGFSPTFITARWCPPMTSRRRAAGDGAEARPDRAWRRLRDFR